METTIVLLKLFCLPSGKRNIFGVVSIAISNEMAMKQQKVFIVVSNETTITICKESEKALCAFSPVFLDGKTPCAFFPIAKLEKALCALSLFIVSRKRNNKRIVFDGKALCALFQLSFRESETIIPKNLKKISFRFCNETNCTGSYKPVLRCFKNCIKEIQ